MRFEVFQGNKRWKEVAFGPGASQSILIPGAWYWRLKSANNQIVAQSEGYTRRNGAERAAAKIAGDLYGRLATVKVIE